MFIEDVIFRNKALGMKLKVIQLKPKILKLLEQLLGARGSVVG
jgi:DNA-binding winged helix-turn-helix (wHTH) protein